MTTVLTLCPVHVWDHAPLMLHNLITMALDSLNDERELSDINLILSVSQNVEQGQDTLRHLMSYQPLDAVLCFGATWKSVGLPVDTEMLVPLDVRLAGQLTPVRVVKLPAVLSYEWHSPATVEQAVESIKVMLVKSRGDVDLLAPGVITAIDNRELN